MISGYPLDIRLGLEWYNVASLRSMLGERGVPYKETKSKAELLTQVRQCLLEPASIRHALRNCSPIVIEALALLKRKRGAVPAAAMVGQMAVWHPELSVRELRGIPSELVRRALAFWHAPPSHHGIGTLHDVQRPATTNVDAAIIYSSPEILNQVNVPDDWDSNLSLNPIERVAAPVSPLQWQKRTAQILRAIEKRQPRILQSGLINARDREAFAQILEEFPDVPGAPGLSSVNFFISMFAAAGLLETSSERHLHTTDAALQFISLPPTRQAETLLNTWQENGENELLALAHLRIERRPHTSAPLVTAERTNQAHNILIDLLRRHASPGYWYRLDDLSQLVRYTDVEYLVSWLDPSPYNWRSPHLAAQGQLNFPAYPDLALEDSRGRSRSLVLGNDWDLVEGAFIRSVVFGALTWLGLVECRSLAHGGDQFALTPLGAQTLQVAGSDSPVTLDSDLTTDKVIVVQPNFDLIIYEPDEHGELLYHVDRFAERISVDRMGIYHLTDEALSSGLRLGLTIDNVIALLEGAARSPIPQNVLYTLRDWARRFEEVRWVQQGWLLEAPNEGTLDRWLEIPQLRDALDRRVTPTIALFARCRPQDLLTVLHEHGVFLHTVDAREPLTPVATMEGNTIIRVPTTDTHVYLETILGAFADRVGSSNQMNLYQISPQSIARARCQELTEDEILRVLDQIIIGQIPASTRIRVKGWAGSYEPVDVRQAALLVTQTPEALAEISADPDLASSFLGTLSPTMAVVRLDALDALRQHLTELGISITPLGAIPAKPTSRTSPPAPNGHT